MGEEQGGAMNAYLEPPTFIEFRMEQDMSQIYTVKCNRVPMEVPAAEVEGRAAALDRYLADPAVAASFPEAVRPYLRPQNRINQTDGITGLDTVRNGTWSLSCSPPRTLFWMVRPTPELMLTAGMRWNAEEERWDVTGIKMGNIRRR